MVMLGFIARAPPSYKEGNKRKGQNQNICLRRRSNERRLAFQLDTLKLYYRYLYTRPCMINHIWGLKQL